MDSEQDVFSEGWSGGDIVSDGREAEALPPEEEVSGAPPAGGGERKEELGGEIRKFVRTFPDVRGGDIPTEVWEEVRGGGSLTEAFLKSERKRLREENARLKAAGDRRQFNASRAAGSQTGEGFGRVGTDAFEEGWEVK